jgi:ferredoxin
MSEEKKLPRIEIIEKYCKGCHICVEFCPTKVLEMKGFVVSVKDLEPVSSACSANCVALTLPSKFTPNNKTGGFQSVKKSRFFTR